MTTKPSPAPAAVNVVNVFVSVSSGLGEEPAKQQTQSKLDPDQHAPLQNPSNGYAHAFHAYFESGFGHLGTAVGSRPWITILIACLVAGVASTGLLHLKFETRVEELWVPDNTQAKFDRKIVEDNFPRSPRAHQVVLSSASEHGESMLSPEALMVGQDIHRRVLGIRVPDPADPTVKWSYEDLCARGALGCWHYSVLLAVGIDSQTADEASNLEKINTFVGHLDGDVPLNVADIMGGVSRDASEKIMAAEATAFTYLVKQEEQDEKYPESSKFLVERGNLWEQAFLEEMATVQIELEPRGYHVNFIASGSWDRELQNALDSEVWLLQCAVALILLYTITMLSRWSDGLVGTRGMLAASGFLCIAMSFAMSAGLCSYLGVVYSPLMGLMPFLLLGVGVDNMFVIVNAFDKTNATLSINERISNALKTSGTSITVTSLTNLLAFIIGAQTSLPVLRAFAFYAALGIFCNYVLQVTLFPALLSLDARRQDANRYDVCIFLRRSTASTETKASPMSFQIFRDDRMDTAMRKLGESLQNQTIRLAVISFFTLLAGAGITGICDLKVDANLNRFIPESSYIHSFDSIRETHFPSVGDRTSVYIEDASFTDPSMWEKMSVVQDAFRENEYVDTTSVVSWFDSMQRIVNVTGTVNPLNFHEKLEEWLNAEVFLNGGSAFRSDVVFNADKTRIVSCRVSGNHIRAHSSKEHVNAMDSLRQTLRNISLPAGTYAFAYGDQYLAYEQFKIMGKEAIINISLALAMVLLVVSLLLLNIKAALLTWINIVLATMEMIGFLRFWGIQLDTTMVIFVVVSMGLIVDYSAHVVHRFLQLSSSFESRVADTLEQVGPAVINAAGSTLFAVLVLSFAKSYVFVLFFRTFFLCIMLGSAHGLLLLPVLLNMWNPSRTNKSEVQPAVVVSK